MRRYLAILLSVLMLTMAFSGCTSGGVPDSGAAKITRSSVSSSELQFATPAQGDTIAIFDTSAGEIRAVLYPAYAPQACDNFTGLAQQGFYNGTSFTKLISGFCAEAGLSADGTASTIWNGSGFAPETTDALHHYSGALCAPADAAGQCSSVFYFMQTPPAELDEALAGSMAATGYRDDVVSAYQAAGGAPYLDYTDTVFGQVYSGMDVIDAIAQSEVDENNAPVSAVTINSVTISTYSG